MRSHTNEGSYKSKILYQSENHFVLSIYKLSVSVTCLLVIVSKWQYGRNSKRNFLNRRLARFLAWFKNTKRTQPLKPRYTVSIAPIKRCSLFLNSVKLKTLRVSAQEIWLLPAKPVRLANANNSTLDLYIFCLSVFLSIYSSISHLAVTGKRSFFPTFVLTPYKGHWSPLRHC